MKRRKYNPNTDYADRYRSAIRQKQMRIDERFSYKNYPTQALRRRLCPTIWERIVDKFNQLFNS